MIKVLMLSIWYPLTMSRYFERAFRRDPNVDLKTTGAFTGSWIPWMGGMNLPEKYAVPPDVPLPFSPAVNRVSYNLVRANLPEDWKPDIVLAVDAGVNWSGKPFEGVVATVATDPHALNYDEQRKISDKFFNMQRTYSEHGDIYLPYAYDPTVHYPVHIDGLEDGTWKDKDVVLIGMPYQKRVQWIDELQRRNVSVIFENSPIFDEYRVLANRARIGLNWSDQLDLNARFFETPAFGLPLVTNRVPDAHEYMTEGTHYLGFDQLPEAVEKVMYLKDNPEEARKMGELAREAIRPHTYDARVNQILKDCLG